MIVSYGLNAHDEQPTRYECDFAALVTRLQSHYDQRGTGPKDGPYFAFADFGTEPKWTKETPGRPSRLTVGTRAYSHLVASYAVPLDIDEGQPWTAEGIRAVLAGYQFVAWTSYRHTTAAPRWRVVVLTERPMSADEHKATWRLLADMFCGSAGVGSCDATRLNYLPGACVDPQAAQLIYQDGALFPVCAAVEVPSGTDPEWRDGPIEGWNGPADDDALRAFMRSYIDPKDSRWAFAPPGTPTKIQALIDADAAALAHYYPPKEPGQDFDHTAADGALANEYLYFTGGDAERSYNLMCSGALAQRPKWREDKARRAINLAIKGRTEYYKPFFKPDPPPARPAADIPAPDTGQSGPSSFYAFLPTHQYIHRPTGRLWVAASLDSTIGKENRELLDLTVPVHAMAWAPGHAERFQWHTVDPSKHRDAAAWVYNTYQEPKPPVNGGDVTPWLDLLHALYPADAPHILRYFADAVQHPERKCNHALVLGSKHHGIGKDTLLRPLQRAVGSHNYHVVAPKNLFDRFNPWVATRILQVSESRNVGGDAGSTVSKYEMYERMKDLCAAPPLTLTCEKKGLDIFQVANVLRVILTTNHGVDGLYIDPEDRRHYCAWSTAPKMQPETFIALNAWYDAGGLDAVFSYLLAYDLTGFNAGAEPPKTEWWRRLVAEGGASDDNPLADALDKVLGAPWVTVDSLAQAGGAATAAWLANPQNIKKVSRQLERAGYSRLPNPNEKRGRWKINGKQTTVYALPGITTVGQS